MNYYRRYSGDYLRDTARLNLTEHGAYNLLLDYYYSEEKPLPLDVDEIYTMVRAMRPEDRKAVDKVLSRYFEARPDGYHNPRADDELAIASKIIETAKENGRLGGRPKKEPRNIPEYNPEDNPQETSEETQGFLKQAENETQNKPANNHPPTTNHQPPSANHQTKLKPLSGKPDAPPEFIQFWEVYPRHENKPRAIRAWKAQKIANGDFERIMGSLAVAVNSEDWRKEKGKYVPMPASWLNGRRWEDERVIAVAEPERRAVV